MNKVCAGIVLFNPNLIRLRENIESIKNQVERIYAVDNGSKNKKELRSLITNYPNIIYIRNDENKGIASALNQLCQYACDDGFEWILTLDQDTISSLNLIEEMIKYVGETKVGILCPNVEYEGWKKHNKRATEKRPYTEVKACMTSASLTRIEAWENVGGFRNEYFIDYVDNEFCMKLKLNGYRILRINQSSIRHQLGISNCINILGIVHINYTKHVPWRMYYMIRNNRAFIKEYRYALPITKEFLKLWYIIIRSLIFSDNKKESLHYIMLGYKHGKNMALGKLCV